LAVWVEMTSTGPRHPALDQSTVRSRTQCGIALRQRPRWWCHPPLRQGGRAVGLVGAPRVRLGRLVRPRTRLGPGRVERSKTVAHPLTRRAPILARPRPRWRRALARALARLPRPIGRPIAIDIRLLLQTPQLTLLERSEAIAREAGPWRATCSRAEWPGLTPLGMWIGPSGPW
jgi:hypothetical protein